MNWFKRLFSTTEIQGDKTEALSGAGQQKVKPVANDVSTLVADTPKQRTEHNLSLDELKQFIPLRDLDESLLLTLPHATLHYPKDAVLFVINQPSDSIYYLLSGTLHLQPASAYGYLIGDHTVRSRLPLNSGHFFGSTAQAVTDVAVVEIPAELNSMWVDHHQDEETIEQLNEIRLPEDLPNKAFFDTCISAYRNKRLSVPSLPDIAVKLNKAMQTDIGITEAVAIIHLDPRIVTKLIQVANSPIYATASPIVNCHDAVARIGLDGTRNLVLSICLKDLFHSRNRELMKGMRELWKHCVYLASLCFVLAQESGEVQPEDAMLAGLIADIGAIPIIHLAAQSGANIPTFAEIEAALPYFRAPVGTQLLRNLEFPLELCGIPQLAENWLYNSGPRLTLADIVILAKLHSYFGKDEAFELPYINSIPAYGKLRDGKLNPDFSLTVLHDAQSRVRAAMQLLV